MQVETDLLRNYWYVAAPAGALAPGAMKPITMLGEELLLLRDKTGAVSALRDFCPHRGIPLRHGKFDGCEVECCYHGWKFDMSGTCTKIPAFVEGDTTNVRKIKAGSYPAYEKDGLIWVYMAADIKNSVAPHEPPTMPAPITGGFSHIISIPLDCNIDHASVGLMDPTHNPFIHKSWWWRSAKSMHAKEKTFGPIRHGFQMRPHKHSSNSRAYKLLGGGEKTVEITYELPGFRTEHTRIGNHHVMLMTALTPVDRSHVTLHQFFYTSIPLVKFLLPLIKPFGISFLRQDQRAIAMQREGLMQDHDSPLLLLGDPDAQALWYYRLKKEAQTAREENRPFENPLREKTLRFVS